MEIPPDLERRLERRWAARVFRTTHRLKGSTQDPGKRKILAGSPASENRAINGFGQCQETKALLSGSMSDLAENGLVR
jgi:hypothetical protein